MLNIQYNGLKKDHEARKAERTLREKALIEKEFELREIENEKHVRSQDTKVNQALEELKKRCKGYLG